MGDVMSYAAAFMIFSMGCAIIVGTYGLVRESANLIPIVIVSMVGFSVGVFMFACAGAFVKMGCCYGP